MKTLFITGWAGLLLTLASCAPKEDIQFIGIKNIVIEAGEKGQPVLKGDAIFNNPNNLKMKLLKADIEILVNEKKSATISKKYDIAIPSRENFTVPVEAQLTLKENGLLNTLMTIFGRKNYTVQFIGTVQAKVHGIRIRVPVNHTEEAKIKL